MLSFLLCEGHTGGKKWKFKAFKSDWYHWSSRIKTSWHIIFLYCTVVTFFLAFVDLYHTHIQLWLSKWKNCHFLISLHPESLSSLSPLSVSLLCHLSCCNSNIRQYPRSLRSCEVYWPKSYYPLFQSGGVICPGKGALRGGVQKVSSCSGYSELLWHTRD